MSEQVAQPRPSVMAGGDGVEGVLAGRTCLCVTLVGLDFLDLSFLICGVNDTQELGKN